MNENYDESNVVAIAQQHIDNEKSKGVVLLSTGYLVKINAVSGSLIETAQASIPEPEVPKWFNEKAGREEENPNHPAYAKSLENWEVQRTLAALDAMLMFGVVLVDEDGDEVDVVDGKWVRQLQFLASQGMVDLSKYDLDDDLAREFLFKKYIAVGAPDIQLIAAASTVNEELVAKATKSFPNNKGR